MRASAIWLDEPVDPADEQAQSLVRVLDLIRSGRATTRPEIARVSGYGRTVVAQRVQQLVSSGLVVEGRLGSSTGGRAPRHLELADVGRLLVAELGATSISVGVATMRGEILASARVSADIGRGPEAVLAQVVELFDDLAAEAQVVQDRIWGVGIGLPGPVEFMTGRPSAPPIMPGWDAYPVRERLSERYDAPVWVDNDVNLMALGELRRGVAMGESDVLFIKVGSGIGAGIISEGRLHRGAQGSAGDVGHIAVENESAAVCRCGNVGCLEALAGGIAIASAAEQAAASGASSILTESLSRAGHVELADVRLAAERGDQVAAGLLTGSARLVGQVLATLVSFYNPSMVVVGGRVLQSNDSYLATLREGVLRRSLPLATRELRIVPSPLRERAGLLGAAFLVIDELLSAAALSRWIDKGSPVAPGWQAQAMTGVS